VKAYFCGLAYSEGAFKGLERFQLFPVHGFNTVGNSERFAYDLARGQIKVHLLESLEELLDISESNLYVIKHQNSILCKDKLLNNPSSGPIRR
jgi:hypothetical protein